MLVTYLLVVFVAALYSTADAAIADTPVFRSDYTFSKLADGWLKLHRMPAPWLDAETTCRLEGAILASPLNEKLTDAMVTLLQDQKAEIKIFTGINALLSKKVYLSLEGVPLSELSVSWYDGEPNNYKGNQNCIVMYVDGTLLDYECHENFPYICYKKYTPMELNECGTVDAEYFRERHNGSCYKFHNNPKTWPEALRTCVAEGGYLAEINSEAEAAVLKKIFEKYPQKSIPGNGYKDAILVGFHKLFQNDRWLTVHGTSLQESGYDHFAPGEPNNLDSNENCGSMFRSSLLNDASCESKSPFICERPRLYWIYVNLFP